MNKLYKSLEKLPDSTKEVIFFDKNGEKHTKTVKVSDRYLLTNNNGNSIAVTKDYLKQIGINVEEENNIVTKPEDFDDEDEINGSNLSPNSNNGVNNNIPIDIIELDIKNAWNLLGTITGESYEEELLDKLFSQFCLGK